MKHLLNIYFIAVLSFAGSNLFAQTETIDFKQYNITLQKEGSKEVQRLKLVEEEAAAFDVSTYISEHIADHTINIWATIVVPISAPRTTASPAITLTNPRPTKPDINIVVAVELCKNIVTIIPEKQAKKRFFVPLSNILRKETPSPRVTPILTRRKPNNKRQTPPIIFKSTIIEENLRYFEWKR